MAFGRFAPLPDLANNLGKAVFVTGETSLAKTRYRVFIIRVLHTFYQPNGIDQEGADDRRIQALVIEYQHRIIQTGL
ncbi:hypothetical protein D3C78_1753470 [compost metagenome]